MCPLPFCLLLAFRLLQGSGKDMDPVHHKPEARNAKSKRSQILWLLLSKHRLMFARTRFLEQRAAGITLPSTTQPEVCRVYEFVPVILVLE